MIVRWYKLDKYEREYNRRGLSLLFGWRVKPLCDGEVEPREDSNGDD